jgi:hypothetical protein
VSQQESQAIDFDEFEVGDIAPSGALVKKAKMCGAMDDSDDDSDEDVATAGLTSTMLLKKQAEAETMKERLEVEASIDPIKSVFSKFVEEGKALETKEQKKVAHETLTNMKALIEESFFKTMRPEQHEKFSELHLAMARKKRLPGLIQEQNDLIVDLEEKQEAKEEEEMRARREKKMAKFRREAARSSLEPGAKRRK